MEYDMEYDMEDDMEDDIVVVGTVMTAPRGEVEWIRNPRTPKQIAFATGEIANEWDNQLKTWLADVPHPTYQSVRYMDWRKVLDESRAYLHAIQQCYTMLMCRRLPFNRPLVSHLYELEAKKNLTYWTLFRINDLPDDILHLILKMLAQGVPLYQGGYRYRKVLSAVCHKWRVAMVNDLTMWNRVWFRDSPDFKRSFDFLTRCGTYPVTIQISDCEFTKESMHALLKKIFKHLPQIQALTVIVREWGPGQAVLDALEARDYVGKAIALERFALHYKGYRQLGLQRTKQLQGLCLGYAPRLRRIVLEGLNMDWSRSPMTNLTVLDLRGAPYPLWPMLSSFRMAIGRSPGLKRLSLTAFGPQMELQNPPPKPEVLPALVELTLSNFKLEYVQWLRTLFHTPNIRSLTLKDLTSHDYTPFITEMIDTCRGLELLALHSVRLSDDKPDQWYQVVHWLHSMPRLRYLRLARIGKHILDFFGGDMDWWGYPVDPADPRTRYLAPNLRTLEFQWISTDDIIEFCAARIRIGLPLKKLVITPPYDQYFEAPSLDTLAARVPLFIGRPNAYTPEEKEILGDAL